MIRSTLSVVAVVFAMVGCEKSPETKRAEAREEAREAVREAREDIKTETSGTRLKVKGSWNEAKGKLKQKYAELTDDDLLYIEGKEEELYGKLQKRLGKSREEVEKILEDL